MRGALRYLRETADATILTLMRAVGRVVVHGLSAVARG